MGAPTKQYKKKADLKTKAGQLFVAQQKGMTDAEAARAVKIDPRNVPQMERTSTYQACRARYGDELRGLISLGEMAAEHIKNIKQDADKGAKNTAIKMAKEYIEPETEIRDQEMVNVIIRKD